MLDSIQTEDVVYQQLTVKEHSTQPETALLIPIPLADGAQGTATLALMYSENVLSRLVLYHKRPLNFVEDAILARAVGLTNLVVTENADGWLTAHVVHDVTPPISKQTRSALGQAFELTPRAEDLRRLHANALTQLIMLANADIADLLASADDLPSTDPGFWPADQDVLATLEVITGETVTPAQKL